jgi:hypothetical protein
MTIGILKVHDMINEILAKIFEPEYRRLATWIDRLCRQNREAHGDPELMGFIYNGKIYKPLECKDPDHVISRRGLHHTLTSDMDTYLMDLAVLTRDKSFISQGLFSIMDPCEDLQDVRDTLPECLKDTLDCISGLQRGVRPEAFTVDTNPRAKRQYEKILPRIEMYAVARLIY